MITLMPVQRGKPVPKRANLGVIFAAIAAANAAVGLDPVEDPSVPKDYTFSVPIF